MIQQKKVKIIIFTGMLILGGALIPSVTLAATPPPPPGGEQVAESTDQYLAEAATLGIQKEEALKYLAPGSNQRDLLHAAVLAKVSGKPFLTVLQMKNLATPWQDVEAALNITYEELHAFHQNEEAVQFEKEFAIPKETTLELFAQHYHGPDIITAYKLAQAAGKPVVDILAMKKINNDWQDIAKTLGVDESIAMPPMNRPGQAAPPRQ
ncbi:MAG: hypothetical protein H6Q74_3234 [Firmicutes bacterium]|nr:hypothetical protein [Bacillota bacterium]